MKLYHYVHCPFCVRVRMVLGYLNINFSSIVVAYDNEELPIKLSGKKMLPIFEFENGDIQNESLDIIKRLDSNDLLNFKFFTDSEKDINLLLDTLGKDIHSLCMPYWIYTPEFNESSRKYFQSKKEEKRGPFNKLIQNKELYLKNLINNLDFLEENIDVFYKSKNMTIIDILIASHLWGMYIFPEFQFSNKIHQYLQNVKDKCQFEYHKDYWY